MMRTEEIVALAGILLIMLGMVGGGSSYLPWWAISILIGVLLLLVAFVLTRMAPRFGVP